MRVIYGMAAFVILMDLALIGTGILKFHTLFYIVIPYGAFILFVAGVIYRVILWARSPVPFPIPTVCGQQQSLPWIKGEPLDSPCTTWHVVWRMALEVFFFRSLFRNDRVETGMPFPRLIYSPNRFLWLGGLLFHWSLAIILVRHLRFFMEPVPVFADFLQIIDGMFHFGLPALFITDVLIVVAITFLLLRRIVFPQIRYISLPADYFALFLVGGIIVSGILMRHVWKVDLMDIKTYVLGLLTLRPTSPKGFSLLFSLHLFLVSMLLAYFPWSKFMHGAGVLFSPTRNLANNSRAVRHINPWNHRVKVHTYEEYEDEFRDAMKEAGLPVEKK